MEFLQLYKHKSSIEGGQDTQPDPTLLHTKKGPVWVLIPWALVLSQDICLLAKKGEYTRLEGGVRLPCLSNHLTITTGVLTYFSATPPGLSTATCTGVPVSAPPVKKKVHTSPNQMDYFQLLFHLQRPDPVVLCCAGAVQRTPLPGSPEELCHCGIGALLGDGEREREE